MAKPWSKLQKKLYTIRADGIRFQIQCRLYRMKSQCGSTDFPRYWITLDKEIIWDYPKDFINTPHPGRKPKVAYPYITDISAISDLIREYVDTPKEQLMSKSFERDYWDLIDIFRAVDKRIGLRRLDELKKTKNLAARKIVEKRLAGSMS